MLNTHVSSAEQDHTRCLHHQFPLRDAQYWKQFALTKIPNSDKMNICGPCASIRLCEAKDWKKDVMSEGKEFFDDEAVQSSARTHEIRDAMDKTVQNSIERCLIAKPKFAETQQCPSLPARRKSRIQQDHHNVHAENEHRLQFEAQIFKVNLGTRRSCDPRTLSCLQGTVEQHVAREFEYNAGNSLAADGPSNGPVNEQNFKPPCPQLSSQSMQDISIVVVRRLRPCRKHEPTVDSKAANDQRT